MHVNNENRWKSRNFRKIRDRSSFSKMANQTENYIDANSTSNNKILPSIQARLKKFKLKIPAAESETIQRNKPTRLKLIKTRGDRISMDEGSMAQIPQSPLVSELTKDSNSNANMKQPRKLSEKLRNFHNMNFRIKGESSKQVSSKQDAGSKDNEIKRLREELISKEKIINGLISDVQFGQFGDSKGIQQKIAKTKESSIVNNLRILCKQMQNELKEKNKQLESLNKSTKVSKLNELSEENRLYISELSKLAKYINSKEKANYDREQLKDIEFNLNDIKDLIPSDGNSDSNQRLMKAVNELETKQTQIESYESELSKLRTENADKDNEIARLENEFEKLLLEVSELEQKGNNTII